MPLSFKIALLAMAGCLLVLALIGQGATATGPPAYTGTAVVNNSGFDWTISLPAASTLAGNYQYAFVDYASTGNYSGAPSGWTQVCVAKGAASIAALVHLNGASEPASNVWGVGGTTGIYAIAIGAVTNSSGVDGSVCSAPSNGAATITTGTPKIASSGNSDFTATWATVSGSAGSLLFSGPGSFAVWAPGASAAEGYYYTGVPVAVTYTNGSGTPHFSPLAAQIAFLPAGSAATPIASSTPAATPTGSATPTPIGGPTPSPNATPTPPSATSATADPNAIPEAQQLLTKLQSYFGKAVIQGVQQQFGLYCYDANRNPADCNATLQQQFTANGGFYQGMVGIDNCSINQIPSSGGKLCAFGPNSTFNQMAKAAWAAGLIIVAHTDFGRPDLEWNNPTLPNNTGFNCPNGNAANGAGGSIYDCGGALAGAANAQAYVQKMLTSGTPENTHWNAQLDLYVPGFLDLQASHIVLIVDMNQETDGSPMWQAYGNLSPGQEAAMYQYAEKHWEAAGVHNLLYAIASNSGQYSGFPGCAYVDITGKDTYSPARDGSCYEDPAYTFEVNQMAACGKPNAPVMWSEYADYGGIGYSSRGYLGQIFASGSCKGQPHMVAMDQWNAMAPDGSESASVQVMDNSKDGGTWQAFIGDVRNAKVPIHN
jgi:Glycosyl hydrolase family 26